MIDVATSLLFAVLALTSYFLYKSWEIGEHDDL